MCVFVVFIAFVLLRSQVLFGRFIDIKIHNIKAGIQYNDLSEGHSV